MVPATSLADNKAPTVHQPGSAGPDICFRNVDCHKTRPRSASSLAHEVPETHPGRVPAGTCYQQVNSQAYFSTAHWTTHPSSKTLSFWTCCLPTSVRFQQCHTEAHPLHIHESSYTTGLAKAKGRPRSSCQKGHRGSNSYILAPRCGPSTVEEGRNGPYRLRDMMMMMSL